MQRASEPWNRISGYRHITSGKRSGISRSLARVWEIFTHLVGSIINLERRPIGFDDLVTIHVFEFWCFPAYSISLQCAPDRSTGVTSHLA